MNKLKTIIAACAACALTSTAMAADPDGKIVFTGEIISGSCEVTGAGAGNSVPVDLGRVLISQLREAGVGNKVGTGTAITMELDCSNSSAGLKTVNFNFDPGSGSGIDTKNNSLLKTTGSATGVGIGLYDGSGQLINLSVNKPYDTALTAVAGGTGGDNKYTATMRMSASFVNNGDTLGEGAAAGTLPFTLTYD
ncbi:fimbrial protein [Comamonas testosteroni]|uniref:fimbrial protein n=1 Tax=Comamonas testosteroni TaxID=285 RepID=UPI00391DAD6E